MKLLRMEFFKCRRRKIALICLAFVAVQLAWMGRTLTQMEPRELAQGWMSLLYNLAVIDAVMLPLTISALASRNCEMEHKGSTWKLWETVTTPQRLFGAKLAWGAILVGGMLLLLSFALCFGVSFVIYALQQGLSLWFVNQAVPLAVGIFGSFVGLFALFFPQWVQRCVIWGYYGVLIQAGMNWDPVTRATEFYWVQTQPLEFGLLALWMIVVLAVGRGLFVRKEV